MYDDILLPFDGSDGAVEILDHAGDLAHWADATVHVLFVADTTRNSVTVVEDRTVDSLVRRGEAVVEEARKHLDAPGVACETDVVQGDPAPTIVEYADRYGHDLVVMPTHGREGISRYLVGSVTENVVRRSSVPVLTARMRAEERLTFPYGSVLVPTDGSRAATEAARHGIELAASLDAPMHLLSVVDDTTLGLDVRSTLSAGETEQVAREAVEELASEARESNVPGVTTHVVHGTPVEEIRNCIAAKNVHAVVMGTTGRRGSDRVLFGSVAEKTVRSAPVPVVTVGQSS